MGGNSIRSVLPDFLSKRLYLSSNATSALKIESSLIGVRSILEGSNSNCSRMESRLVSLFSISPLNTIRIFSKYRLVLPRVTTKESVLYVSWVACFLSFVDEYPGMYSRSGVKAINKVVRPIRPIIQSVPVTNTLRRLSLKDIFSSKVLSLSMTNRYLCKSFLLISFLFLTFLAMDKYTHAAYNLEGFYKNLMVLPCCGNIEPAKMLIHNEPSPFFLRKYLNTE